MHFSQLFLGRSVPPEPRSSLVGQHEEFHDECANANGKELSQQIHKVIERRMRLELSSKMKLRNSL